MFTIELANRGYNIILIMLPSAFWLLLVILQSRSFVILTELENGKVEIFENSIFTKRKTIISLLEIVDFRYMGSGHGFGIEKFDGSMVWISVNISLGRRIANHIRSMKLNKKQH